MTIRLLFVSAIYILPDVDTATPWGVFKPGIVVLPMLESNTGVNDPDDGPIFKRFPEVPFKAIFPVTVVVALKSNNNVPPLEDLFKFGKVFSP